jgi:ATP-dependent exoDNAse (exonuclease V) beta subunit
VLGRIFDKRIKPGEDISNSAKASAMLRNLSDNLLERRLVGGKEGTDTLSRIFGPSGGLREGFEEIEALEDEAIALREKGETKKAAAIETLLKNQKTAYEIKKIDSEAMKNIAEAAKSDYSKATQGAMELATIRGFTPGTAEYMAEVDAILSVAVTEGQASIIKDVADLQSQLSTMDPDSNEYKAMQDRINMLQRQSVGTTINTDAYSLPEMTLNPDGSPRTS